MYGVKRYMRFTCKRYSGDNSVLLMWAIDPMLDLAFDVIESWGFTYKTVGFTWAKTNKTNMGMFTGLGYWTRAIQKCVYLQQKVDQKELTKT